MSVLKIKNKKTGKWETITSLKGEAGPAGKDGVMTFEELTPEQIESLRGPKGDQGIQGIQGETGPAGPAGQDGKDYVLTEEDKAEIAGMVPGADVDLSDYYTKTEIDDLLANLPAGGGDIPSGEEVKF